MIAVNPKTAWAGFAGLVLAAAFFCTGCPAVEYRAPSARIGSDVAEVKVLSEAWRLEVGTGADALSGKAVVRAFKEMKVVESGVRLRRDYGWYTPWNPLVEIVEWLAVPWLLLDGLIQLYTEMAYEPEDGGAGDGWFSPEQPDPFAGEDYSWVTTARDVDSVARETDWYEHFAFAINPWKNGRYVFPSRVRFGQIGPIRDGGAFSETRIERAPWADSNAQVIVNGKPVEPVKTRPGEFEIDLLVHGEGPVSVRASAKSPSGEDLSAGLDVAPGRLRDMREAAELRKALEKDPSSAGNRAALAVLEAREGSAAAATRAAERMAAADPKQAAAMLDRVYTEAASAAAASGNALEAYFVDALRDFHRDMVTGSDAAWECRTLAPRRIVIESMGSDSFLDRARGAVTISKVDGPEPEFRTAALLALLRNETNQLSRWACYAGLERCAIRETARMIELLAAEESNAFVRERAFAAAAAAKTREEPQEE